MLITKFREKPVSDGVKCPEIVNAKDWADSSVLYL